MSNSRVIVALDYPDAAPALEFAQRVSPDDCRLKIGKELFTATGPALVETLVKQGFDIFLDLKFHDIPNTVAGACKAAARLGVWMMNVHASGGSAMMEAARQAVGDGAHRPKLIAVTLLTSMGEREISEVGIVGDAAVAVGRLARLAQSSGLDGVVCSAQEAAMLRKACGPQFCLVTPGIRPADASADDQHRVMTPAAAISAGADYLVIGRPVTQSRDPVATLAAINREVGGGTAA